MNKYKKINILTVIIREGKYVWMFDTVKVCRTCLWKYLTC